MASDHALLSSEASVGEAMAHKPSQKRMLCPWCAEHTPRCRFASSVRDNPLFVLFLITMFTNSMTVDVLPSSAIAKRKLVGCDADDRTVPLM